MSFDIFFQPCRFGGQPIEKRDRWTGKVRPVLPNEPLTAAELQAVKHVLAKAQARGSSEHNCYCVELPDGGSAEIYGRDLGSGSMAAVRGMTPDLLQFLHDLLRAGNWVMFPAMKGVDGITAAPASLKGIPEGFPTIIVCNSKDELGILLADGVAAWQRYRDQVVVGGGQ